MGSRVPVAWKNGKPVAILGHSWRRAQFHPRPVDVGGDLQTVAGIAEGGVAYLILSSAERGPFILPLTSIGLYPVSPKDVQAKWVETDSTLIAVLYREPIAGGEIQHAVIVRLPRGENSPEIPLDDTAKPPRRTIQGQDMPVMKCELVSHYQYVPREVVVRTLQVNADLLVNIWRLFTWAFGIWEMKPSWGFYNGYAALINEGLGTYQATGKLVRYTLGASCLDFFAVKREDGTIDVLLTYAEDEHWRPGDMRTSEQCLDELGQFVGSWKPSLSPFLSSVLPFIPDFLDADDNHPWLLTGQAQVANWPPRTTDPFLMAFPDDQRPFTARTLLPWECIFRCPHAYVYNARTATLDVRTVAASTTLTVKIRRYVDTSFCVPWWDPTQVYLGGNRYADSFSSPPWLAANYWYPDRQREQGGRGQNMYTLRQIPDNPASYFGWYYVYPNPFQGASDEGSFVLRAQDTCSTDADVAAFSAANIPDFAWGIEFDAWPNPYVMEPWRTEFAEQMQLVQVSQMMRLDPITNMKLYTADMFEPHFGFYYGSPDQQAEGSIEVCPRTQGTGTRFTFYDADDPGMIRYDTRGVNGIPITGTVATLGHAGSASPPLGGDFGDLSVARVYYRVPRGIPLPNGLTATLSAAAAGGIWQDIGEVAYRVALQRTILRVVPPSLGLSSQTIQLPACQPVRVYVEETTRAVTVTWTPPPDATGYIVYRQDGTSGGFRQVATLSGQANVTFTDMGTPGGALMPAPLGKDGVTTVGGPVLQDWYGQGHLSILKPVSLAGAQIARLAPASFPVLATLPFTPTVLRINTRWAVLAEGAKKVHFLDLATNTVSQASQQDIDGFVPNRGAFTATDFVPSASRLFWFDPDAIERRKLLRVAIVENVPRVELTSELVSPVRETFPFGTPRNGMLFPPTLDGA